MLENLAKLWAAVQDNVVWHEYLETVMKERGDWKDLYRACRAAD